MSRYSDKLCLQRKHNGDPCTSFALLGEDFCHYHKVMGMPKVEIDNRPSGHTYLPVFEDAVSIQSAISDVCEMMLHRRIEPKEASILLYAMQVAATNMAHMNGEKVQLKHKREYKRQNKNQETTGAEPSSAATLPSIEVSAANSTSPSEPQSPPPGTIQACEERVRPAFE